MLKLIKIIVPVLLLATSFFAGCKKEPFFKDTGVHDAKFNGTVLQYLNSKPVHFDSLSRIIKIAGMEEVFDKENITFFAPTSATVHQSVHALNYYLARSGRDTVTRLEQLKPAFWRKMLAMYVFKGNYGLKDYPQIDTAAMQAYPGQGYNSISVDNEPGRTMNIGVVYNDAGGVKYAGYRQLMISYIGDYSNPTKSLILNRVASSDIAPTNGRVHVLQNLYIGTVYLIDINGTLTPIKITLPQYFGFDVSNFIITALSMGIDP
ncbi:fasciclin domain-containing protein [Pedobacter sp. N36a]|uniref:fasciclin domain-containing protein n=1 Tax=Pedobacter sp. N36a TaxID=2767996 RepID=UPI001656D2C3|nr:fasciclin domain-containing protein [Pedobacter sp. N36a]MBC8986304.1 fasciclin domain-containing protein [Pedobacter sp. N36a]